MSKKAAEKEIVYVVDDDAGVRDSLCIMLEAKGLSCIPFPSGEAFLDGLNGHECGCVILDYFMNGMTGIATLKTLREGGNSLPVLMVTAHGDVEIAVEAMRHGATDFIEKPWEREALFDAVDRALEQNRQTRDLHAARKRAIEIVESFTPREREVFQQLITGSSNKLIARALDLSPRTVEFYRANVLQKADAQSVAELVRLGFMAREIRI
jgi:two-component system, LuxR family, response regulator FixJ